MHTSVISGTGLWTPSESIGNDELVASQRASGERFNREHAAEIEAELIQHPKVADVAVFGIPSEEWGESVHAVLVCHPDAQLSEADAVAYAREHLAGYKIPRSVSFEEEIPRTGSGKILKRVLREPFWKGRDSGVV